MKLFRFFFTGIFVLLIAACTTPTVEIETSRIVPTSTMVSETISTSTPVTEPTGNALSTQNPETFATQLLASPVSSTTVVPPTPTHTPKATLGADEWQKLPIVPEVSDKVIEIYQTGQALGNQPQRFSKIGDCGSTPAWFLGDFDRGPDFYNLGEHTYLESVIDAFHGSFERTSLGAHSGFNASSLFSPLWSDRTYCQSNESPLSCEYRVNQPVIAFIMLGTNDIWKPEEFEPQMRKILEYSIENGVIPIISTKADNAEGDHFINQTIARLAWEYDIPLLNYWLAVQPLPDQGLQEDGAHLTWGRNFFNDPQAMNKAWPVRNLTALQALNAVWEKIRTLN